MNPHLSVIAHRGASSYAPENILASFDLAIELGADALETDVRATRDGVLVLLHDAQVDRTIDGHGPVSEKSWAELQSLDAGGWFDRRFAGARVPTLAKFLARYAGRVHLALEIKAPGIEAQVIEALTGIPEDQYTITAFEFATLERFKRLRPSLRVGWLAREFGVEQIERVAAIGGAQICPPANAITADLVTLAHRRGLGVRAWGVADETLMARAVQAGVDGMTVNFPDKLIAYLRAQGTRPA